MRLAPRLRLLVLTLIPAALPAAESAPRFSFAAFGCMPYRHFGGDEAALARVIAEVNHQAPAFTVELGDILGGDEVCTDELLLQRRAAFNTIAGPLIYTPGDNEWTDVHTEKAGRRDPLERLAKVRELFFADERSLGQTPIPLVTQWRDPRFPKFVENARWTQGRVVFATVHVVGSHNNRQPNVRGAMEEWRERDAADEAWVRETFAEATRGSAPGVAFFFQADPFGADGGRPANDEGFTRFLAAVEEGAKSFGKPVLLVHADEHRYRLDIGVSFRPGAEPVRNVTRLETFGAANLHAVLVVVDPGSPQVFQAGPLIVPGNPLPTLPRPKPAAE